ncbi:MAG: hypothetical protein WCJ33_03000 [Pseudomonadota bacterium]
MRTEFKTMKKLMVLGLIAFLSSLSFACPASASVFEEVESCTRNLNRWTCSVVYKKGVNRFLEKIDTVTSSDKSVKNLFETALRTNNFKDALVFLKQMSFYTDDKKEDAFYHFQLLRALNKALQKTRSSGRGGATE